MIIHQLRSAAMVLEYAQHRWLVDPMLGPARSLPPFRLTGTRRRNPLVDLPSNAPDALATVTALLVTHEHPDHFDSVAVRFAKERSLPVYTNRVDLAHLRGRGLDARLLEELGPPFTVEVVRSKHGRGAVGWLMGPVCGYVIAHPDEPTVYLTGDSILTESVLDAVDRHEPDVIVAPAGAANFGVGGDILFSVDELVSLARRFDGTLVCNHLEALDHCPTTRAGLRERFAREGLLDRVRIPADGERVELPRAKTASHLVEPRPDTGTIGMQKWMTQLFA